MNQHMRDNYLIPPEGIYAEQPSQNGERWWSVQPGSTTAQLRKFRFSRMCGKDGKPLEEVPPLDEALLVSLADAMTAKAVASDSDIPAGFTFLLQFLIHVLTYDKSSGARPESVTVAELNQGRSPTLDLDSLYGRGPRDAEDARGFIPTEFA